TALALDRADEVAAKTGSDRGPDRSPHSAVDEGVVRLVLRASHELLPLETRRELPRRHERLAFQIHRIVDRPPPGRLDRASAVRGDDEVGTGLVEALPQLPPRGSDAVSVREVDRRSDRQDLR